MARVIFDLDGTLVDSVPSLAGAANAVLAQYGREGVDHATYASFVGRGMTQQMKQLLRHTGGIPENFDEIMKRFIDTYNANPLAGTVCFAGVPSALASLREAGHSIGVATQKPEGPARVILEGLGLMPMIAALTGGDTLGVLKPDPRMITETAARMGEGKVIFVGDSDVDADTASAAQVPFILHTGGYTHGDPKGDAAFSDWQTLPALVARFA